MARSNFALTIESTSMPLAWLFGVVSVTSGGPSSLVVKITST